MTLDRITRMDDRAKLMLVDKLLDSLPESISDSFDDVLRAAFRELEADCNGAFVPFYPAYGEPFTNWTAYRARRDALLSAALATLPNRAVTLPMEEAA